MSRQKQVRSRKKITKRLVDRLPLPESGQERVYDNQIPGFGVIKFPTGKVSFFLTYGGRKQRRLITIGQYGPWTVEQAREEARRLLGDLARGIDPAEQREAERKVPTFTEWLETYLEDVDQRKKSAGDDRRFLKWIEKSWGKKPLDKITTDDVTRAFKWRHKDHGKISANRFLASVRACLQAAWRVEKVPENVAARVRLLPENQPRDRVLSDEELGKVLGELDKLEDPHVRLAFELLLSTGARKSEVLRARWEDVDLEAGTWRIPSPKAGHPQTVPLPRTTVAMLKNTPEVGPWLVPGRWPERHREDIRNPWKKIREAAGCEDVTIHDLRRTYGLHVARTAGLHVASRLLRHSTVRITERVYAPLGIDELRKATEIASRGRGKVLKLQQERK